MSPRNRTGYEGTLNGPGQLQRLKDRPGATVYGIITEFMNAKDWLASFEKRRTKALENKQWSAQVRNRLYENLAAAHNTIRDCITAGKIVTQGTRISWAAQAYAEETKLALTRNDRVTSNVYEDTTSKKRPFEAGASPTTSPSMKRVKSQDEQIMPPPPLPPQPAPPAPPAQERVEIVAREKTTTPPPLPPTSHQSENVLDGDELVDTIVKLQDACSFLLTRQKKFENESFYQLRLVKDKNQKLESDIVYLKQRLNRYEQQQVR